MSKSVSQFVRWVAGFTVPDAGAYDPKEALHGVILAARELERSGALSRPQASASVEEVASLVRVAMSDYAKPEIQAMSFSARLSEAEWISQDAAGRILALTASPSPLGGEDLRPARDQPCGGNQAGGCER